MPGPPPCAQCGSVQPCDRDSAVIVRVTGQAGCPAVPRTTHGLSCFSDAGHSGWPPTPQRAEQGALDTGHAGSARMAPGSNPRPLPPRAPFKRPPSHRRVGLPSPRPSTSPSDISTHTGAAKTPCNSEVEKVKPSPIKRLPLPVHGPRTLLDVARTPSLLWAPRTPPPLPTCSLATGALAYVRASRSRASHGPLGFHHSCKTFTAALKVLQTTNS